MCMGENNPKRWESQALANFVDSDQILQNAASDQGLHCLPVIQGPIVQSVISLTSLLRVISLTVLADSIYNIMIFFAEKM